MARTGTELAASKPDARQRPARLLDVAAAAGVSLGSASRALSRPDVVKPATLAKVRAAAAKLGYVPDRAARALASGRSDSLGLLAPTLANPIYAAFVQSAERAADARGRQLLITADEYDRARGPEHVLRLIERGVDGLILIGADHDQRVFDAIAARGTPHVFAWSYDEARGRGCVGISNGRAVWGVVRHLLDLGHRRFGVLSGVTAYNERARSRLEGIRAALATAGIVLDDAAVAFCPFSIDAGREGLSRLLAGASPPTAIICGTDLLAAGAMAEAVVRGLHIPEDLSVTGFDDVDYAALLNPPLTTVRVPAAAMGARAVEVLLDRIDARVPVPDIELAADLVLRGSTGPAPHKVRPDGRR